MTPLAVLTQEQLEALVERAVERALSARAEPLLSIEEAARVLGVSTDTVRRRVKSREIPARRVGSQWRIERSALAAPEADVVDLAARTRAR